MIIRPVKYILLVLTFISFSQCTLLKEDSYSGAGIQHRQLFQNNKELDGTIKEMVEQMSLDELAGQMIISYPDRDIVQMGVGGVIFFHHHIKNQKGIKERIKDFNKLSSIPLLVMIDQEGGMVNTLKNIKQYRNMPSARGFGKWGEPRIVEYNADLGSYMKELKINTVLAPCLDVSAKGSLMYKLKRSFHDTVSVVEKKGAAFARGFQKAGVLTVGKHFPGYGEAMKNSDISVVLYPVSLEKLEEYISVYKKIREYLDGIMMSSIIYSGIDMVPAVFSKKLVKMAREVLPEGLIISDDIQSKAIREYIRQYLKKEEKTIERETVIHSRDLPYSWPFTISEIKYTVDHAFDAGITLFLTLDPQKAIFIKHYLKEKAENDPDDLDRLKYNVYLILKKKMKIYKEYSPNV
ncbi:MAG: hypothetical protein KKH98_05145 [Spirochaetes bacterium]|nr:hypothetical protein [Spirochaetota bacterium]